MLGTFYTIRVRCWEASDSPISPTMTVVNLKGELIINNMDIKEIDKKSELLNLAASTLKSEFIGIDKEIDEIISLVRPWYLFRSSLSRPTIICLWGMTGVGKSAVVRRLVELIGYKNKYMSIDSGKLSSTNTDRAGYLTDILDDCLDCTMHSDEFDMILNFDEFQLVRTIDESGCEIPSINNRDLWELLDTGMLERTIWNTSDIKLAASNLPYELERSTEEEAKELVKSMLLRLRDFNFRLLFNNVTSVLGTNSKLIDNIVNRFSPKEICDAILKSVNTDDDSIITKKYNFSKSLIFIIGNLDEAYDMTNELNPDNDPDILYEKSKSITITDIKESLLRRFRSEQVNRLGNSHIIYRTISSESYRSIIKSKLANESNKIGSDLGIKITFDNSIEKLIYDEGVYAAHGVRPILSSIYELFNSKIVESLSNNLDKLSTTTNIEVSSIDSTILVKYSDNKVDEVKFIPKLLDKRKSSASDSQALTAVHESGHALLYILLTNKIPNRVLSMTTMTGASGFMEEFSRSDDSITSADDLLVKCSIFLGGLIAEELVFGEDNKSLGSSSDISSATKIITDAIYKSGLFVDIPIKVREPGFTSDIDDMSAVDNKFTESVRKQLWYCNHTARTILGDNLSVLIKLSKYLADHSSIGHDDLKKFMMDNASSLSLNGNHIKFNVDKLGEDYYHNYRELLFNN